MRPKCIRVRARSAKEGSAAVGWSLAAPEPPCFPVDEEAIATFPKNPEKGRKNLTNYAALRFVPASLEQANTSRLKLPERRNEPTQGAVATNEVRVLYAMTGCFLPKPVACSNACAICRTLKSSLSRPTICTPTGSPSGVKPPVTEAAGLPVAEMYQHDFIQSM